MGVCFDSVITVYITPKLISNKCLPNKSTVMIEEEF